MATTLDATLSYDDWLALPESSTPSEVVAGRLIVTPQPVPLHQFVAGRLYGLLSAAAPAGLEVLPAPVDWVLARRPLLVRQPDVTVVTTAQVRAPRLESPPVLAIEIVSATSRERDLVTKRTEYATADLPWYWIVDPDEPEVVVLRNVDGRFERHAGARGTGELVVAEPFAVRLRPADLIV